MEKTFKETLVTVENKQFTTMINGKEFQSLFGNVAIPITKFEPLGMEPSDEYVTPGFKELFMGGLTEAFFERCRFEETYMVPTYDSEVGMISDWLRRMDMVWGGESHDEMDVNVLYGYGFVKEDGSIVGEFIPVITTSIMKGVGTFDIPSNFIKIRKYFGYVNLKILKQPRFRNINSGIDATKSMMNHPYGNMAGDVFGIGCIAYFGSLGNVFDRLSNFHGFKWPVNDVAPLTRAMHVTGKPSNISSLI